MSFLSKRFIQTFPPGVPVDVSFLLLHLFRALHEGTLVDTDTDTDTNADTNTNLPRDGQLGGPDCPFGSQVGQLGC